MTDLPNWKLNPLVQVAGSSESVVEPCPEPYLKVPPFLGSARAAVANMVFAAAAVMPTDMAKLMKSRRDSLPRLTALVTCFIFISNSVMCFLLGDQIAL